MGAQKGTFLVLAILLLLVVPALAAGCATNPPLPVKALELNRDGAAALAAGDLETAEARIALALEYSPRFTEAWVNLGQIEEQHGNFELARRDFVKARHLNPDLPVGHHALGLLADREGHPVEAERYYRAALKVDPAFAPARINLARKLFERGAFDEAREHFLRLTQIAPDFPEGWTGLCEALLRVDRVDDARAVLRRARQTFGPLSTVLLLEARLLLRANAFAEAEERLVPLTRIASSEPATAAAAFAWLAIARLGKGDVPGATQAAERATALEPDDGVARYALRTAREMPATEPPARR
jgi:Flp pilus assembly protein TadD